MRAPAIILQLTVLGAALWLGLYLLARNPQKPRLRWTGFGLVAYAIALTMELIHGSVEVPVTSDVWQRLTRLFILLPAVFWTGALVHFLPERSALRRRLSQFWAYIWLPAILVAYGVAISLGQPAGVVDARLPPIYLLFATLLMLPLLGGLLLLLRSTESRRNRSTVGVLVVATIFFGLQVGWFLFPFVQISRTLLLLGIGFDLFLLGAAIAWLDAFAEGEAIRRDMIRSFSGSLLLVALFAGQVALLIFLTGELTFPLLLLLLSTVTVAIAFHTFSDLIHTLLDVIVFGRGNRLVTERASYRAAAREAPRLEERLPVQELDDERLYRLTRRALSHFGDLARLSGNPLTRLALIERRLAARGAKPDTLEQAAELKALLAESIERLKPRGEEAFGTSDEWRYYNALYFPYVVGLKPYSRRAIHENLDPIAGEALTWFRQSVPERTLYNWQAAAATLVAQDLREKALRTAGDSQPAASTLSHQAT